MKPVIWSVNTKVLRLSLIYWTMYNTRNSWWQLRVQYGNALKIASIVGNNSCLVENVAAFNKLNTIKKLVGLMENQPEDVLINVVGALGACAKTSE